MQDDCYLIASEGWKVAAHPKLIIDEKGKKSKTPVDFIVEKKKYAAELIPPKLIIARYYSQEFNENILLEANVLDLEQQIEEIVEEYCGENGLLEDAKNEKDKLTKASVSARLKEIKDDADSEEEIKALKNYLDLVEKEAVARGALKLAEESLSLKVANKYKHLTEEEVKALVVEDKWLATLASVLQGELNRVSQTLTGRIRELAERYSIPLPVLDHQLLLLSENVNKHLKNMGASWS
jgi:type I restriction enzyme M protein